MIYLLDRSPLRAATMLADKEVNTSALEVARTLVEVPRLLNGKGEHDTFTHWVASDEAAYVWTAAFYIALLVTFSERFKDSHGLAAGAWRLMTPPPTVGRTGQCRPPPQNVARRYRCGDPVTAYRNAYFENVYLPHWSAPDKMPDWFSERVEQEIRRAM